MEIFDLYNILDKENINVYNYNWDKVKGRIFELEDKYTIAIDYTQIENSIDEKQVLAEELGHYYCNALYYLNSDKILKRKCENRAKKWAYSVLVPLQKLKEKIAQNFNLYDLADYFDVDYEYMNNCINFYIDKYGSLVA